MSERPDPLERWHQVVRSRDATLLDTLLAEDCVFRSPAVHTPQEGRALTTAYLTAALTVLGPEFHYRHAWWDEHSAVLEFETVVDGLQVHGIDMMRWGSDGRLTEFTVMVRPFKGLTQLMTRMAAELEKLAG